MFLGRSFAPLVKARGFRMTQPIRAATRSIKNTVF
jgi:hypothetical protein